MNLADIREFLKTRIDCPNWYIGKIDGSKDECIGLYSTKGPSPNIALGGLGNTSYGTKTISILVHWGMNARLAEIKAQEVYNSIFCQPAVIGGKRVVHFDMRTDGPVGVGTDDRNIYEYVIEVVIYYER
ncbi:MAG: phage tail terminator protein [Sphaerochaetaceae bacterium]